MKSRYRAYFVLFLFSFTVFEAALEGQTGTIRGRITDTVTNKVVDFASVLNYSRQIRTYSNGSGEFMLEAGRGDTLVFSAVGFYYRKIIVTDSLLRAGHVVVFPMDMQAYEIDEARILGLGTYDQFRKKFVDLDRPVTNTTKLADELAVISHHEAREAYEMAKANRRLDGITLLTVPILTPEEKERIALGKIMKQEEIREKIYQKFNPGIIRKVTDLTDDDEIIEFMVFCDFPDKYILGADEYELLERIVMKYAAFKRKKNA
jgi:hypothetical protein